MALKEQRCRMRLVRISQASVVCIPFWVILVAVQEFKGKMVGLSSARKKILCVGGSSL